MDKSGTSCVHIYTGDGKGKTCSAVGLAVRAAGHNKPAVIIRFLKALNSGEDLFIIGRDSPYLKVYSREKQRGFYPFLSPGEQGQVRKEEYAALEHVKALIRGGVFLIVLDEVLDSIGNGILTNQNILDIIELAKAHNVELVMTGRAPDKQLLDRADYITHFENRRHPYRDGIPAREGIEY